MAGRWDRSTCQCH
ncbi:hypothetical protein D3W54_05475 [Komagataeibacter medellinensis]|uniref:Uncharacterized protein n=1 Tax=Komagataeibacter medellinensis TaxID=1177712 RepID=A0ABQ6VYF2_9PROT|nr:hypothetical protein D3W54_05475 [Komagataeibacter medellinensis]